MHEFAPLHFKCMHNQQQEPIDTGRNDWFEGSL